MKPAKFDTQPSPHFLMESATVDYTHADIRKLASALSSDDPTATARHCFEWYAITSNTAWISTGKK
ncbi:hypothetical protein GL267_005505 [Acidithiobacillus ferrianus]|uniref:Uncharacterized protein n=1 Tax=Acidithiobacillus ferrianus TaxID=2678518 RepID=A0ACD5H9I3_9PROT|nr:hypothetical protein [Acidithiobacillus ferrianus]